MKICKFMFKNCFARSEKRIEDDLFNTKKVLRRLLSTANHALKIQIEENQKLRTEVIHFKRALVRNRLTNRWQEEGCLFDETVLSQIDLYLLKLNKIDETEAQILARDIMQAFAEEE